MLYCLWASFLVSNINIQGNLPKTNFPNILTNEQSAYSICLLRVDACTSFFKNKSQCMQLMFCDLHDHFICLLSVNARNTHFVICMVTPCKAFSVMK